MADMASQPTILIKKADGTSERITLEEFKKRKQMAAQTKPDIVVEKKDENEEENDRFSFFTFLFFLMKKKLNRKRSMLTNRLINRCNRIFLEIPSMNFCSCLNIKLK